jgi:beta-glucanase (GH16 family)
MRRIWIIQLLLICNITFIYTQNGVVQFCNSGSNTQYINQAPICNNEPEILVFEDDFNGNSLDLTKWQIQVHKQGVFDDNTSSGYSSLNNVTVGGGICNITAKKETVYEKAIFWLNDNSILSDGMPNLRYFYETTANLWSRYKFGYGRYEIRCKISPNDGFWPAFWMFGTENNIGHEIDVFEFWDGDPSDHNMNLHRFANGSHIGSCLFDDNGTNFSTSYHTFTLIYDPYTIEWLVDGVSKRKAYKYVRVSNSGFFITGYNCGSISQGNYSLSNIFPEANMNIIFNMAIQEGSNKPSLSDFPANFEIDYIKYWRRNKCNGSVFQTDITNIDLGYNDKIIGTNIDLRGNFTLITPQKIEALARDGITLGPGFATNGNEFNGRIDQSICAGITARNKSNQENTTISNLKSVDFNGVYLNTSIFDFQIKDHTVNTQNPVKVQIIDIVGKIIFELEDIVIDKFVIDFNNHSNGIYLMNILDSYENQVLISKKIILNK